MRLVADIHFRNLNRYAIYLVLIFLLLLFFLFGVLLACFSQHLDECRLSCSVFSQQDSDLRGSEGARFDSQLKVSNLLEELHNNILT